MFSEGNGSPIHHASIEPWALYVNGRFLPKAKGLHGSVREEYFLLGKNVFVGRSFCLRLNLNVWIRECLQRLLAGRAVASILNADTQE
jgi:hypothetical protein